MNELVYEGPMLNPVTPEMLDGLLLWAAELGASDVILCPDDPFWVQLHGVWHKVTTLCLTAAETAALVCALAGQPQASSRIQTGQSIDFAYLIRIGRGQSQRFRVNATNTGKGIYIVMRSLPRALPLLEDLHLEPELVRAMYPPCGLVIASGVMGSGKSTLLAGVLHTAVREHGRQVLTLEEPIEFDLGAIPHQERSAPVGQSNVGIHVPAWSDGVRTLTRRKAEIVLVGEARDRETLSHMIAAVEQGVTAYSTVHAQDVPQTITRIVNAFDEEERPSIASVLKANLRLIIHQRLVARIDRPGRVALREYLIFDEGIRQLLYRTSYQQLIPVVRALVNERGQSLSADAGRKREQGVIARETYDAILHEQQSSQENGMVGKQ